MRTAFDDFMAAEGKLASLLNALPTYEAPSGMEQRLLQRLHEASPQPLISLAPLAPVFEPPPEMAARFHAEASRTDAAQVIRRNALLSEIAAGREPATALGSHISPATESWLRAQAQASSNPQRPLRRFWGFSWRDLGLAATAMLVAVVATRIYLDAAEQKPANAAVAVADKPSVALSPPDVSAKADGALRAEGLQMNPVHDQASVDKQKSTIAAPAGRVSESAMQAGSGTTVVAKKPASPQPAQAPELGSVHESLKSAKTAEASFANTLAPPPAAAPAPASTREEKIAPAPLAISSASITARSEADSQSSYRRAAVPAKPLAKSVREISAPPQSCLIVSLKYDPALIAHHLDMSRCGQIVRLKTANPDVADTLDWAERFRAALPEGMRPMQLPVERDAKVPLDLISIDALPAKDAQ